MPLVDAALAFTITMLFVATVVTQLVDLVFGLARQRQKDLKQMLLSFYDEELRPKVEAEAAELDESARASITKALTGVQLFDFVKDSDAVELSELKTQDMLDSLKRSELGKQMTDKLGDQADAVFDELTGRYESIGGRVTALFRRRARTLSTVIALGLALLFSIDAVHVIDRYLKDPVLREAATSRQDAVLNRADAALADATEEDFDEAYREARQEIRLLQASSLPLGWSNFPYCGLGTSDVRCLRAATPFSYLRWIFGCLLTAYLAGVGAPFWRDALKWIIGATRLGGTQATKNAAGEQAASASSST